MADLSDEDLARWLQSVSCAKYEPIDMQRMALELQRHRATMMRINDFDLDLRGDTAIIGGSVLIGGCKIDGRVSRAISDRLRAAIKGEE